MISDLQTKTDPYLQRLFLVLLFQSVVVTVSGQASNGTNNDEDSCRYKVWFVGACHPKTKSQTVHLLLSLGPSSCQSVKHLNRPCDPSSLNDHPIASKNAKFKEILESKNRSPPEVAKALKNALENSSVHWDPNSTYVRVFLEEVKEYDEQRAHSEQVHRVKEMIAKIAAHHFASHPSSSPRPAHPLAPVAEAVRGAAVNSSNTTAEGSGNTTDATTKPANDTVAVVERVVVADEDPATLNREKISRSLVDLGAISNKEEKGPASSEEEEAGGSSKEKVELKNKSGFLSFLFGGGENGTTTSAPASTEASTAGGIGSILQLFEKTSEKNKLASDEVELIHAPDSSALLPITNPKRDSGQGRPQFDDQGGNHDQGLLPIDQGGNHDQPPPNDDSLGPTGNRPIRQKGRRPLKVNDFFDYDKQQPGNRPNERGPMKGDDYSGFDSQQYENRPMRQNYRPLKVNDFFGSDIHQTVTDKTKGMNVFNALNSGVHNNPDEASRELGRPTMPFNIHRATGDGLTRGQKSSIARFLEQRINDKFRRNGLPIEFSIDNEKGANQTIFIIT